jgi:hypothetical protein
MSEETITYLPILFEVGGEAPLPYIYILNENGVAEAVT